jgi:uncharacterized protein YceK
MKKQTLFILITFAVLMSGCAAVNEEVKGKFGPMVGTGTYKDVLSAMSMTKWPDPKSGLGNCDLMGIEFGDLSAEQKERINTTYTEGNLFEDTKSVAEKENYTILNGVQYWFIFDKDRILRYYDYAVWRDNVKDEEASGGDENLHSKWSDIPVSRRTGCDSYFGGTKRADSSSGTETLEQKLSDLKQLRDKKVISDVEYKKMRENLINSYK